MRKYLITTLDKFFNEVKSFYDIYNPKEQPSVKKHCEELEKDSLNTIVSATYKECKKVYQVVEQHFTKDLYSGNDYLMATSPFNKGKAFKSFEEAVKAAHFRKEVLIEQGETFDFEELTNEPNHKSYKLFQGFDHYSPKTGIRICISVQELFIIP